MIKNKKQYAYEKIRELILNGTFMPGYRIVIDRLSKEIGCSSIPVREALGMLESDGLIEYTPFSGAVVRFINETEYVETLSVLGVMEGYASALSSEHTTKEDIGLLSEINEKMTQAIEDYDLEQFSELNREFHSVIYNRCQNRYLVNEIKNNREKLSIIRGTRVGLSFRLSPRRCLKSIEEHKEIIRLLSEKANFSSIESFVRHHKLRSINDIQEKGGPNGVEIKTVHDAGVTP